jgi:hypothetical protein
MNIEEDKMNGKFFRLLFGGVLLYGAFFALPARGVTLVNLTTTGASIPAGNLQCPDQRHFHYIGGLPDPFTSAPDPAYPSPNLLTFMTATPLVTGIVHYDVSTDDMAFGESFNLQNTRSVCYALLTFKVKKSTALPSPDGLTVGHAEDDGSFTAVARVLEPGTTQAVQEYAFDATALGFLSNITGTHLDKNPFDSILDIYLMDDTLLDFIEFRVWYGPNCSQSSPATC